MNITSLDHLIDAIPIEAQKNRISLYTIALEGWRRGLELSFHITKDKPYNERLIYTLRHKDKVHYFSESSGDKNKEQAHNICHNKDLTYQYLERNNIPIPKSLLFQADSTIEHIIKATEKMSYPLVVKPTDGSSGRGVIVNISNKEQLRKAIKHVRQKLKFKKIIIQEHVEGEELRFYVLDNRVLAVTNRQPANIVGDGRSTIYELIESKNELRKLSPHLRFRPIRIDQEVRQSISDFGYTLDSVLEKNKRIFLRKISNISTGGESIDVTNEVTQNQKDIAIRAVQSIPGLAHAGIDMIITGDTGVVLEVNTRPGIGMHMFPSVGNPIDIPKSIIDYYFPETKNIDTSYSNVYFDLQTVFDAIYNGYTAKIKLKPHPKSRVFMKKVEFISDLDTTSLFSAFRKYIISNNIYGYIKQMKNNSVEILIGHDNQKILIKFKKFLISRKRSLHISNVKTREYNKPIKMTFEIIDDLHQLSIPALENELMQLERQLKIIETETNRLKHRIKLTEDSTSWKITAPLRKLKDVIPKNK